MGDALLHGVPPQGVLETLDGGALEEIEQQSNPGVSTPAARRPPQTPLPGSQPGSRPGNLHGSTPAFP